VKPFVLEESGKTIAIHPAETLSLEYEIGFKHPLIGYQKLEVEITAENYRSQIAPARTFGFYHEVEALQAAGLVRGGSLENAIVLTETGMLNETSLRYPDEFVRHKILDLLGDFALMGQQVLGRLTANRAGHALHTRFVAQLLESTDHWAVTTLTPAAAVPTATL
jgi:UDP-3-O-[3-hydroxymyristoyl] N-acetylglucosamine deacetylase